jgi:hypothetical protein
MKAQTAAQAVVGNAMNAVTVNSGTENFLACLILWKLLQ